MNISAAPNDVCLHDDATSVETSTATNAVLDSEGMKTIVVKWDFSGRNKNEGHHASYVHMKLLETIETIFPNTVQIYDKTNRHLVGLRKNKLLEDPGLYLNHFDVQSLNQRDKSVRYMIYHKLRLSIPLQQIRQNPTILKMLKAAKVFLRMHHFEAHQWDTVSLGWLLRKHPRHHQATILEQDIREELANDTFNEGKAIPLFKVVHCSPKVLYKEKTYVTKSYEIQCNRSDRQSLDSMLRRLYTKSQSYIKYRLRYDQPLAFARAITAQNIYIANVRVIPVDNIAQKEVFDYIRGDIYQSKFINDIHPARKPKTWNLFCDVNVFEDALEWSDANIARLHRKAQSVIGTASTEISDCWVRVNKRRRNDPIDDASRQSEDTYLTASTMFLRSIGDLDDDEFLQPPQDSYPPVITGNFSSWLDVVKGTSASTSNLSGSTKQGLTADSPKDTTLSDLTTESTRTMSEMLEEVTALRTENHEIKTKFVQEVAQLKAQNDLLHQKLTMITDRIDNGPAATIMTANTQLQHQMSDLQTMLQQILIHQRARQIYSGSSTTPLGDTDFSQTSHDDSVLVQSQLPSVQLTYDTSTSSTSSRSSKRSPNDEEFRTVIHKKANKNTTPVKRQQSKQTITVDGHPVLDDYLKVKTKPPSESLKSHQE